MGRENLSGQPIFPNDRFLRHMLLKDKNNVIQFYGKNKSVAQYLKQLQFVEGFAKRNLPFDTSIRGWCKKVPNSRHIQICRLQVLKARKRLQDQVLTHVDLLR